MRPQPSGFEWIETAGGPGLVCTSLHASHIFTTRGGRLGAPDGNRAGGWAQVAAAMDVPPGRLARIRQVHGSAVSIWRKGTAYDADALPEADVIASDDPSLAIAIQTADCVPMLIADVDSGAVAAAHAGWRGLAAGVPSVAVATMVEQFNADASRLVVAIGPSISAARYEVGDEVRSAFERSRATRDQIVRWFQAGTRPGHWLFDGWLAGRDQLESSGVAPEHIHVAALCTAAHPEWFCSYRRDGRPAGRMAAAFGSRVL